MEENKHQEEQKQVVRYRLIKHRWPDEIKAEKDRKLKQAILVLLCIGCFLSGFLINDVTSNNRETSSSSFQKLEEVYRVMANNWYFGKDIEDVKDTLVNQAIAGMLNNKIDPHTMYMNAEESQRFTSSLQGNFVGIGIQYYASDEDTATVDRVFKGSGAEKGGMIKGDVIIKVDGVECAGKTLDEISTMIKGEEGTDVKITVLRENKEIELTITRSVVNDSVYGYEEGDTGIIEINSFSETSGKETGKYLEAFKGKGVKNLIIDLRDNGGGYVDAAMQIGSYLLPEGKVIYKEESKKGNIVEKLVISDYETYSYEKIIILVNDSTASASEVLTSSLKEQLDNVVIVGINTYGKGTVQVPMIFEDGSSIKYTIAEWLTPNENHINGVGIKPDIEVKLDPAITAGMPPLSEGVTIKADTVSPYAKPIQLYLKFLGYPVDREDEYFSFASSNALKTYQQEHGLEANGEINEETVKSLLSSSSLYWHQNQDKLDLQLNKAFELLQ